MAEKEYIEREAILKEIDGAIKEYARIGDSLGFVSKCREIIIYARAADVVEVVRCKDCKHFMPFKDCGSTKGDCDKGRAGFYWLSPNDFCSYGAKMDGKGDAE